MVGPRKAPLVPKDYPKNKDCHKNQRDGSEGARRPRGQQPLHPQFPTMSGLLLLALRLTTCGLFGAVLVTVKVPVSDPLPPG